MNAPVSPPTAARHCKIAILGSGFSGLGMAIRLRQQGEQDFLLFEKEAGVGGTWRVNNYPGCGCDVQSHLYSFSFEPNPNWTRMFAKQPEIRAYLEGCWEKYRLQDKTRLGTEVVEIRWDEQAELWHLLDRAGNRYSAQFVVSGMGGHGKNEICLQLAHRFPPKFWGVFWIDVSSTSLAERSLLNLAQTLSLAAQTWEDACLGIANLKHPWLLVLDNADPALDYQPYIPSSPRGW